MLHNIQNGNVDFGFKGPEMVVSKLHYLNYVSFLPKSTHIVPQMSLSFVCWVIERNMSNISYGLRGE